LLIALRSRADLVLEKMCLCEQITGCGQYTPFRDGQSFQAGTKRQKGDLVHLYVELRNTDCELRDRYYVTALNATVTLTDATGMQVWKYNYRQREKQEQSLKPISDCYRPYDFFVPEAQPGLYTLTLEVVDETRPQHRTARKSIPFHVAPPAGQ